MEFLLLITDRPRLFQKFYETFRFLDSIVCGKWYHNNDELTGDVDIYIAYAKASNACIKKYYFTAPSTKEARNKAMVYTRMEA